MLKPPDDVPAEVLFRTLLGLPRPSVDILYRLPGAADVALGVRALTAAELAGTGPEVVASSLTVGRQPAFASAGDVCRLLSPGELERLMVAVAEGLGRCSPVDGRSDYKAWQTRLVEGARHHTNRRQAYALGSQLELMGKLTVGRPERFWGVPAADLVDAHWFAFRAAREVFLDVHAGR